MSAEATFWAWRQNVKSSYKLTLLALANCHNENTGQCNPSIAYISKTTGLNKKTIISALEQLEEMGLIVPKKQNGKGSHYRLLTSTENGTGAQGSMANKTGTKNGTTKNGTTQKRVYPKTVPVPKTGLPKNGTGTGTKNGTAPVPKTVPESIKNLKIESKNNIISDQSNNLLADKPQPTPKNFIKPNLDQIANYFSTKTDWDYLKCSDLANRFFDHYETNGWRVGKSPMKNWEAACRTWIRNNHQFSLDQKSNELGFVDKHTDKTWREGVFIEKHTDRSWADGL